MRALILLSLCVSLSGCYVAFSGHQNTAGGVTTATTGAAVRGQVGGVSGRFGAAFGAPPAPGMPGGLVSLPSGASALLLLGLMIGDAVNYFGARLGSALPSVPRRDSVAETCSCYGWKPGLAEVRGHE